jgi:tRNA dimethylallyltransferase
MSLEEMQAILKERSLETYNAIDHQNPRRIIRALIQLDEGTSHQDIKEKNDGKPIYPVKFYRLEIDKEEGNKKIDTRIDQMVKQGLIQEVTSLYERYPKNSRPFTTIGYIEIIQAIQAGKKVDQNVIDLIKTHTHQYAKKQRTFLRHQFEDIQSGSKDEIYEILKNELEKH